MMVTTMTLIALIISKSWKTSIAVLPVLMIYNSLALFSPMGSMITTSPMFSLDQMSVMMIMLTLWISMLMLMASMKIKAFMKNHTKFLQATISLTLILVLAFSVNNLFSYYIMFEASLIPTLLMILMWGYQPERLEAGTFLILYTVGASLPLLMVIILKYSQPTSIMYFIFHPNMNTSIYLEIALLLAFLIKLPMYLTHLWLPKAHVEAPVAGSMILASILLKLGAYGLLRTGMMYQNLLTKWSHFIMAISLWGAVMTSFLCIRQTDMKAMIAYSSVSHMALLVSGLFTYSTWGWSGALVMMIAHGLSSSGLFALANMYYEHTHSRSLLINKGVLFLNPPMTMWWMLMIAANMACPPSINMMAEVLLTISIVSYSFINIIFLIMTCFFTACYSLVLYTSLHHGTPHPFSQPMFSVPIYYTVSFLHLIPLILLISAASQLACWI